MNIVSFRLKNALFVWKDQSIFCYRAVTGSAGHARRGFMQRTVFVLLTDSIFRISSP